METEKDLDMPDAIEPTDSKKDKTNSGQNVSLILFLLEGEIKSTELIKWAKKNKEEFKEQAKEIEIGSFDVNKSEQLDRFLDIVPKLSLQKDRGLGKKIVAAIFRSHDLSADQEFPPTIRMCERFLERQRTVLNERIGDITKTSRNDENKNLGIKELESYISFELNLVRLLLLFIQDQSWLTPTFLSKMLSGFTDWNQSDASFSFEKSIITFSQTQKSTRHLICLVDEFSYSLREVQNEAQQLRIRSSELYQDAEKKDQKITTLNADIQAEKQQVSELTKRLNEEIKGRESDQRVTEVYEHDLNAKVRKTISRVMKSELSLIKEMLSDGDEFHNQILDVVSSLEDKLEGLR